MKNKKEAIPYKGFGKKTAIKNMVVNPETKYLNPDAIASFEAGNIHVEFSCTPNAISISWGEKEEEQVFFLDEKEIEYSSGDKESSEESIEIIASQVWDACALQILYISSSRRRMTEKKEGVIVETYGPVNIYTARSLFGIDIGQYNQIIIPEKEMDAAMQTSIVEASFRSLREILKNEDLMPGYMIISVTSNKLTPENRNE